MNSDIPQWVMTACRRWGNQKRRIWAGTDWHGNVDGYAQSLLGRIREERDGASQCEVIQRWPEVFWGDGLDVQKAIQGMPELPLTVFHLDNVFDRDFGLTAGKKAAYVELSIRSYWDELKKAQFWVFARLDYAHTSETEIPQKIMRPRLKLVQKQATKLSIKTESPSPSVNWAALRRPKLSL